MVAENRGLAEFLRFHRNQLVRRVAVIFDHSVKLSLVVAILRRAQPRVLHLELADLIFMRNADANQHRHCSGRGQKCATGKKITPLDHVLPPEIGQAPSPVTKP
jgi:hypothetical protein